MAFYWLLTLFKNTLVDFDVLFMYIKLVIPLPKNSLWLNNLCGVVKEKKKVIKKSFFHCDLLLLHSVWELILHLSYRMWMPSSSVLSCVTMYLSRILSFSPKEKHMQWRFWWFLLCFNTYIQMFCICKRGQSERNMPFMRRE